MGNALIRWGQALKPATAAIRPAPTPQKRSAVSQMPGLRSPLTIDKAVRNRDLSVLKREASDALAALGAAHAVVSSARLAQIQTCLLYTSPSPRDLSTSRMPSSA